MSVNTFNIVSYIENTPIIALSTGSQSRLIRKIQEKFTKDDEHLFIASFYSTLNHDDEKDFIISLDDVWKWLGFSRKNKCKDVLLRYFKENQHYVTEKAATPTGVAASVTNLSNDEKNNEIVTDVTEKAATEVAVAVSVTKTNKERNLGGAGQNKERILMTIKCFKLLCLKAGTKKADDIHEYYLKMEKVLHETVIEEARELTSMLLVKDKNIEQTLLFNFDLKPIVYLIVISEHIIKFGYSNNIRQRMKDHRLDFNNKDIKLVYAFETLRNREVEILIKRDERVIDKIFSKAYGTETKTKNQTELIKLDNEFTLDKLRAVVEDIKTNANGELVDKLMEEVDRLKMENVELKLEVSRLHMELSKDKELELKKLKLKEREIEMNQHKFEQVLNSENRKPLANEAKYQVYDPDTLELVKTFESIRDAVNETEIFSGATAQTVGKVTKNNKIYKGYRFWKIERNDENKKYDIPPTVFPSKAQKYEQIVQLNPEKTKIINISGNIADAAEHVNKDLKENNTDKIKKSISNNLSEPNALARGFNWMRISEIDSELLKTYNGEIPDLKMSKNQKRVYKFGLDKKLKTFYNSVTEALHAEHTSGPSLKKAINNKDLLNNSYWGFEKEIPI
jgi:hypothetical protein